MRGRTYRWDRVPAEVNARFNAFLSPNDRRDMHDALAHTLRVPDSMEMRNLRALDFLYRTLASIDLREPDWEYKAHPTMEGVALTWRAPPDSNAQLARALVATQDTYVGPNGARVSWDDWFQLDARASDVSQLSRAVDFDIHRNAFYVQRTQNDPLSDYDDAREYITQRIMNDNADVETVTDEILSNNAFCALTQLGFIPRLGFEVIYEGGMRYYQVEYVPVVDNDETQWYFLDVGQAFAVNPNSRQDCKAVMRRVMKHLLEVDEEEEEDVELTVRQMYPFSVWYQNEQQGTLVNAAQDINEAAQDIRSRVVRNANQVLDTFYELDTPDSNFFMIPNSVRRYSVFVRMQI
jgi:hypothetical protein